MALALNPLCLIQFWSWVNSPFPFLALWGKKNWPPNMKVKNKMGCRGCKCTIWMPQALTSICFIQFWSWVNSTLPPNWRLPFRYEEASTAFSSPNRSWDSLLCTEVILITMEGVFCQLLLPLLCSYCLELSFSLSFQQNKWRVASEFFWNQKYHKTQVSFTLIATSK